MYNSMKGNNGNATTVCEVPRHVTFMQWILFIREYTGVPTLLREDSITS
jgi:hypothetical protein